VKQETVVAVLGDLILVGLVIGLITRGRWRLNWAFAAYVPVVLVARVLVGLWPSVFYVYWFWMAEHVVFEALKMAIALELAWRIFRNFPNARAAVGKALLGILMVTLIMVIAALPDPSTTPASGFLVASGELYPRVLAGTAGLLAATMALALRYHIPVHPFHSGLITSLTAYVAVFGSLLRLEGLYGWTMQRYLNAIDPVAYLLVTCWWARIAWRKESDVALAQAEILERLQLRAASCG